MPLFSGRFASSSAAHAAAPEEIYNNPANTFVAGFVGSPQMNFIDSDDFPNIEKKDVTLGIRPEKMITGGDIKLNVNVEITELLGSEKIAYFNIGNQKCSAKLSADKEIGQTLELSINPNDIYYFDKNTGLRI